MQPTFFHNLSVKNNAIFALCFVASLQVLCNDQTNPEQNLKYFLDGNLERSKIAKW